MSTTPTSPPAPPAPEARRRAFATLADAAATGRLTLGEYAEHAAAVERAATPDELEAALADVPAPGERPTAPTRSWLIAILGGSEHRGRWRLAPSLRVIALVGGAGLDLGAAETQAPVAKITVIAVFGGVELKAPAGVSVQLSGVSILGGKSDERPPAAPLPGSPLIRVRAVALFGGVKITQPRAQANG